MNTHRQITNSTADEYQDFRTNARVVHQNINAYQNNSTDIFYADANGRYGYSSESSDSYERTTYTWPVINAQNSQRIYS